MFGPGTIVKVRRWPWRLEKFTSHQHNHLVIGDGYKDFGIAWKYTAPSEEFMRVAKVKVFRLSKRHRKIYWWLFGTDTGYKWTWPTFKDQPNYAEPFELRFDNGYLDSKTQISDLSG